MKSTFLLSNGRKGSAIYSFLSLFVILIIIAVALYVLVVEESPHTNRVKNLEQEKAINAIESFKSQVPAMIRTAEYPAIWKAGHRFGASGTVNEYLEYPSAEEGKNAMLSDLKSEFASNFNDVLCRASYECTDSTVFIWRSDDIRIRISAITADNVEIMEDDSTGYIKTRIVIPEMSTRYRDIAYDEKNVTIEAEVCTRLLEMYDRAYGFNKYYDEEVDIATTGALYTRVYLNAYSPLAINGSFLKTGDITYNLIDLIFGGDIEAMRGMASKIRSSKGAKILSLGSVPAATWLWEWGYFGEPAFLPPGVDIGSKGAEKDKIVGIIRDLYDINATEDCDSLENEKEKEECESLNDPDKLRERITNLIKERERLQNISNKIEVWERFVSTDMACLAFKVYSEGVIDEIMRGYAEREDANNTIINPGKEYTEGTELSSSMTDNENDVKITKEIIKRLSAIKTTRLPALGAASCRRPDNKDCSPCPTLGDVLCSNPSCNIIECPSNNGNPDYECGQTSVGSRSEQISCKRCTLKCNAPNDCALIDCKDVTLRFSIPTCNCECHPTQRIIGETRTDFDDIKRRIDDAVEKIESQERALEQKADILEKAKERLNYIDELASKTESPGFDVVSRIDYDYVQFNKGSGKTCQSTFGWNSSDNGICGNKATSTGWYVGQVTAATICCALAQPCCATIKYAVSTFPVIYDVEAGYRISETIRDEKGTPLLYNLGASDDTLYGKPDDPQLFTYVPVEFEIYRNHSITAKPKGPAGIIEGHVFVYLYLPLVAKTSKKIGVVKKVLDNFEDPTCSENKCGSEEDDEYNPYYYGA